MRFSALVAVLFAGTLALAAPAPKAGPHRVMAVFSNETGNWQIYLVQPGTGETKQLSDDTANDLHPTWSPDGKQIAFVSYRKGNQRVWVMKADGTDARQVAKDLQCATPPRWSPDGSRLAFVSPGDAGRGGISVVEIATGKVVQLPGAMGEPDWSPDGKKLACFCGKGNDYFAYTVNADGTNGAVLSDNKSGSHPVWSPDGYQLAFVGISPKDNSWQVYTIGVNGKNQKQITKDVNIDYRVRPKWSPDGSRIAFSVIVDGKLQVAVMDASGSDVKVLTSKCDHYGVGWSPDGKSISYARSEDGKPSALWVSDPDGGNAKEVFRNVSGYAEWKPK